MKEGKIRIIDFNDSFVYNIASEFYQINQILNLNLNIKVIPFKDGLSYLQKVNSKDEKRKKNNRVIVLGPGPGRPNDYDNFYSLIKSLLSKDNFFIMGICLGHQILWSIRGHQIVRSNNPMHGQSISIRIPRWPEIFPSFEWGKRYKVQRYNSLTVDLREGDHSNLEDNIMWIDGECMASYFPNCLSYQFHPESVGTSFPFPFLYPAIKFLYNTSYGCPNLSKRYI